MLGSGSMPLSRRGWLLGTALFAVSCLSPTLPLPPPSEPSVTSTDVAGLVRLTGVVRAQSEVFAMNHSTNLIRGQYTESGEYDFTIEAQERDSISLWYVHGTAESLPNDFLIRFEPTEP
jgi:hypothetical protein